MNVLVSETLDRILSQNTKIEGFYFKDFYIDHYVDTTRSIISIYVNNDTLLRFRIFKNKITKLISAYDTFSRKRFILENEIDFDITNFVLTNGRSVIEFLSVIENAFENYE